MYWKLAIQNIRRSLRDYIIYFVTLTLIALCDVLLFRDELFYYESFGLFAVLILVQLAVTGATFSHTIKVKYTIDGKDYICRKWIGAGNKVPDKGTTIKVTYWEDKASKARIEL